MKIWYISHYCAPPTYESASREINIADELQKSGHECTIFSASTVHNSDVNLIQDKKIFINAEYDNIKFVHIKTSDYNGNGLKRILNMRQFAKNFAKVAKHMIKPDIIIAKLYCLNYKGIFKFAKKNNIKIILEIGDLWPLSIVEYFNISNRNPLMKYLYRQEKKMYLKSDAIVFYMEGGEQYIKDKGWDDRIDAKKIFHINNGVNLDSFNNQKLYEYQDNDLDDDNNIKILYAGSIRKVNKLGLLLDTANEIKERGFENIKFIIFGDGDEKAELEERCRVENIDNVIFKGRVNKKYIPSILSRATINYVNVQQTEVMRYGCSLNKLFDYLAAGKPIVSNLKVNYDIIEKYNCGITAQSQSPKDCADAICKIINMDKNEYLEICKNSYNAAQNYDYSKITQKMLNIINGLIGE